MENTEEIYTDFARVYDELMDNTPYEMWCNRLDQLIASYGVSRPTPVSYTHLTLPTN